MTSIQQCLVDYNCPHQTFDMIDGIYINIEGYMFCLNKGHTPYVNVVVNIMCLYLDLSIHALPLNSISRCEHI